MIAARATLAAQPRRGFRGFYVLMLAPALVLISVTEPRPGLWNYELLLTSASVQRALWTTGRIAVLTTLITLMLATTLGISVMGIMCLMSRVLDVKRLFGPA